MATKKELREAAYLEYLKVQVPAWQKYREVQGPVWAEYEKRLAEINAMSEDPDVAAAIQLLQGKGAKVIFD